MSKPHKLGSKLIVVLRVFYPQHRTGISQEDGQKTRGRGLMGRPYLIAATLAAGIATTSASEAKLTRLEILEREVVADGQPFGAAGPYERLTGTAFFEVDPKDPHNAVVFDLDKAPVNAAGKVEFSADMVILRPVEPRQRQRAPCSSKSTTAGARSRFGRMHDTASDANMNPPTTPRDFGNGFLMQARLRPGLGRLGRGYRPGRQSADGAFPDRYGAWPADHRAYPDRVRRSQLQRQQPHHAASERWHGLQELSCGLDQQAGSRSGALGGRTAIPPAQRTGDSDGVARAGRSVGFRCLAPTAGPAAQAQRTSASRAAFRTTATTI